MRRGFCSGFFLSGVWCSGSRCFVVFVFYAYAQFLIFIFHSIPKLQHSYRGSNNNNRNNNGRGAGFIIAGYTTTNVVATFADWVLIVEFQLSFCSNLEVFLYIFLTPSLCIFVLSSLYYLLRPHFSSFCTFLLYYRPFCTTTQHPEPLGFRLYGLADRKSGSH